MLSKQQGVQTAKVEQLLEKAVAPQVPLASAVNNFAQEAAAPQLQQDKRALGEVTLVNEDGTEEVKTYDDCGCCDDAIPLVDPDTALVCLLLNIFVTGAGTMLGAYRDVEGYKSKTCCNGVLQMCLAIVIAGSVWSIIDGVRIYQKAQQVYGIDYATVKTSDDSTSTSTNTNTGSRRLVEDKKNI